MGQSKKRFLKLFIVALCIIVGILIGVTFEALPWWAYIFPGALTGYILSNFGKMTTAVIETWGKENGYPKHQLSILVNNFPHLFLTYWIFMLISLWMNVFVVFLLGKTGIGSVFWTVVFYLYFLSILICIKEMSEETEFVILWRSEHTLKLSMMWAVVVVSPVFMIWYWPWKFCVRLTRFLSAMFEV